ncbi:MAG: DUF192 domain-containing protein [Gemmatimonadetes bacterium]|nr:DUF192 domain-containing protein [Gemmatimonadota bacterium]
MSWKVDVKHDRHEGPWRRLPALRGASAGALAALALLFWDCGRANGPDARAPEAEPMRARTSAPSAPGTAGPTRGKAWIIMDGDTVVAEVASTPEERQRGLMYRTEVPPGTGMLFVFEQEQELSFWMQDTYVPLDIAFIAATGRIVDIQQMAPRTTDLHTSKAPALFALEVLQGWFGAHDVEAGHTVRIIFGPR